MCETKTVRVPLSLILLLATSFCIYQAHTEKKMGHDSKIKSQNPSKMSTKKCCLNGGDCYYLNDEDIVCFMAIGLLMCVMTVSFALPVDFSNLLGNRKTINVQSFFKKLKEYHYNYHDDLWNNLVFISCNSNLVLTCSLPPAKTDPIVSVDLLFLMELKKCFFVLFSQDSLLGNAG